MIDYTCKLVKIHRVSFVVLSHGTEPNRVAFRKAHIRSQGPNRTSVTLVHRGMFFFVFSFSRAGTHLPLSRKLERTPRWMDSMSQASLGPNSQRPDPGSKTPKHDSPRCEFSCPNSKCEYTPPPCKISSVLAICCLFPGTYKQQNASNFQATTQRVWNSEHPSGVSSVK